MPAIRQQHETLRAELVSFRVASDDHWGFGQVRIDGAQVGVTGKLLGARPGDTVELGGAWVEHPRYGRQFKVRSCEVVRPEQADGIVAWLASRLPDVGEGRARALVEQFGENLWGVIESRPFDLTMVDGITPERAEAIAAAYRAHRAERDQMIRLKGWGLTDNQVAQCLRTWGELERVVEALRQDPYQLSQAVHGFGFLRSDQVARAMGVPHDSPARVRAGIEHVLSEAGSHGHCYVPGRAVQKMAAKLLDVPEDAVGAQVVKAGELGRVVRRGFRVYTPALDSAESRCARAMRALLAEAHGRAA